MTDTKIRKIKNNTHRPAQHLKSKLSFEPNLKISVILILLSPLIGKNNVNQIHDTSAEIFSVVITHSHYVIVPKKLSLNIYFKRINILNEKYYGFNK